MRSLTVTSSRSRRAYVVSNSSSFCLDNPGPVQISTSYVYHPRISKSFSRIGLCFSRNWNFQQQSFLARHPEPIADLRWTSAECQTRNLASRKSNKRNANVDQHSERNVPNFESCTLRDGSHAFSFFDECPADLSPQVSSWQLGWAKTILGVKEVDPTQGKLYYRVGYCPVALDKGFAKAKTLLFPGFKKTPEYEALDNIHMPPETKRRLQRLATDSDMTSLWETNDFSALKWFHDNGVPQVIQTTEPLFRGYT